MNCIENGNQFQFENHTGQSAKIVGQSHPETVFDPPLLDPDHLEVGHC